MQSVCCVPDMSVWPSRTWWNWSQCCDTANGNMTGLWLNRKHQLVKWLRVSRCTACRNRLWQTPETCCTLWKQEVHNQQYNRNITCCNIKQEPTSNHGYIHTCTCYGTYWYLIVKRHSMREWSNSHLRLLYFSSTGCTAAAESTETLAVFTAEPQTHCRHVSSSLHFSECMFARHSCCLSRVFVSCLIRTSVAACSSPAATLRIQAWIQPDETCCTLQTLKNLMIWLISTQKPLITTFNSWNDTSRPPSVCPSVWWRTEDDDAAGRWFSSVFLSSS